MNTNNGNAVKLYPVNLEKAESTLRGAITGINAKDEKTVADYETEKTLHEADRALRMARCTYGRYGTLIAWVTGKVYGVIKGAQLHNEVRWAAMNA